MDNLKGIDDALNGLASDFGGVQVASAGIHQIVIIHDFDSDAESPHSLVLCFHDSFVLFEPETPA